MSKLISKIVVPDSSEATGYALYNVKDANAIPASEKGVASGVATLDSSGKVPSSQLPSYVDDVIEGYYHDNKFYATYTPGEEEQEGTYSDEITPELGKIYVDIPTNQSYRWSGSTYIVISSPYVLPTASANILGGVKVGDGLSIDNNGVLSAEGQEVEIGTDAPVNDVKLFVDEDADPAVSLDVYTRAQTDTMLGNKVDKITGKGLSTNDFDDTAKDKLDDLPSTSEAAVSGGTDLSLVTTGEKYTWNNKSSAITTETLTISNGVYAIYADGSLKTAAEADSNALGVAVITDDCCFVIDKTNNTLTAWDSLYETNGVISGCTAVNSNAKLDFAGVSNTNAIASVASGGGAAKYCRQYSLTIGGVTKQGYLGACGELYAAYQNKTDVNTMMTAIGGTAIINNYYWSSTLYLSNGGIAWRLHWDYGNARNYDKDSNSGFVRPFYPITKQEFAGETITTNIPTVTIEQSTGSSTTNVMSQKAVTDELSDKADSATTIAGYGITDAYTKTQIDALTRHTRLTDFDLNVLKQAVADGNLEKYGLKVGDLKTIDGYTYVIAGLNPMKGGLTPYRLTENHVGLIVIPHVTHVWNASGNTSNSRGAGYINCDLHYYLKNTILPHVQNDLGSTNLLGHKKLLSSEVTNGAATNVGEDTDCKICALSEVQVYGSTVCSNGIFNTGEACRHLDVFQKYSHTEIFGREYPWLRDIVSASDAACARGSGDASYYSVSYNGYSVAALVLFH